VVVLRAGILIFLEANHVADTYTFTPGHYPLSRIPVYVTTSLERKGTFTNIKDAITSPVSFPVPFEWSPPTISPVYDLSLT